MSPFQQAQMFSLQDPNIHNIAVEGRVRRLPGHRQGGLERPRHSSASTGSAPSTPSTGRACWRRWCTTSPATSRPRRPTRAGELRGAVGQLRQHLRRPRGPHDGPADPAPRAGHQREPRARRVLPHRHLPPARPAPRPRDVQPVDGHLQGLELRALRVRPAGPRRRAAPAQLFKTAARAARALHAHAGAVRAHRRATASCRATARMPTAWPPSATPTSASA